ncbi:MAG: barstar family protein [Clostridia bacterium]|nr:barstar family protein [Clostridia bacterium]
MESRFSLINLINENNLNELLIDLSSQDFEVLEIDGDCIYDSKTFFKAVKDSLPFDPPISGKVNWDAFSDSLWEGIMNLENQKVAIVWTKAENMLNYGLGGLIDAIRALTDVSTSLYNDAENDKERVTLTIFLIGKGNNFSLHK